MPETVLQIPEKTGREPQIEMTADVQGIYPNFKQKLAYKVKFVIFKVNKSQLLFAKCCLRAVSFQKIDK